MSTFKAIRIDKDDNGYRAALAADTEIGTLSALVQPNAVPRRTARRKPSSKDS